MRCPTCRAIATVDQSHRRALQEHSDEVMSPALTTPRRETREREERTARRARSDVRGAAARGSRVICSICNGVVEGRTHVRVVCSCCLHLCCALGLVEDSAHGVTGSMTITCPKPRLTVEAPTHLLWIPSWPRYASLLTLRARRIELFWREGSYKLKYSFRRRPRRRKWQT